MNSVAFDQHPERTFIQGLSLRTLFMPSPNL
jgi:hypothetical protein